MQIWGEPSHLCINGWSSWGSRAASSERSAPEAAARISRSTSLVHSCATWRRAVISVLTGRWEGCCTGERSRFESFGKLAACMWLSGRTAGCGPTSTHTLRSPGPPTTPGAGIRLSASWLMSRRGFRRTCFASSFGHRLDCSPLLLSLRRPELDDSPCGLETTQSAPEGLAPDPLPPRIPFNVIDEAVHVLDSTVEPWSIHLEVRVAGTIDETRLRAALGLALPGIRWRAVARLPPGPPPRASSGRSCPSRTWMPSRS